MIPPDLLICYCRNLTVADITRDTPPPDQCTGCWGDLLYIQARLPQ